MKKIIVKKRHSIRKNQVQDLFERLTLQIGPSASLFQVDNIEILETNAEFTIYLVNKKPLIMDTGAWVFPTLRGAVQYPFPQRMISVDAGAIPYVVNGADVMRPGIVAVSDDIVVGMPVQIVDDRYKKPLAVAVALMDGAAIRTSASGKMCKSVHHVGDELWSLEL